ncbi:PAS domain-containing protein [Oceanicoccus sagamiensis]|uniref:PAS fold-4 domain-containing protein n=1 Tax=Oceanicoccus sagamiensis TaxID=716816 RepID=A0A1X9NEV7_9GAMM|nr:PAS domain-containing protein [Oceanicoccus sagamiensis]ARN74972.1 hypothetical protein BST96_13110 [Oceanicoccus sagamiensis]
MFDESEYILIKTDQQLTISYTNQTFQQLINTPEEQLIGENFEHVWRPDIPASIQRFSSQQLKKLGFYNGYASYPLAANTKSREWIFFDFGKRYSTDGTWLGYEYIGYCPSVQGIDHFDRLFAELAELEDGSSDGLEKAQQHLHNNIESTGMGYEELVCILQDL